MPHSLPAPGERQILKENLDQLRREFSWHRHYAEHFFSKAAVRKYPDETERARNLWEYHERQMIRGYNEFQFWTLGVSDQELKAHRDYMTGLREQFKDQAWAWMLDEKEQIDTYRRFAARAGMDFDTYLGNLHERPSDYTRRRAMPDSPLVRAERQLDAMTRTEEGHRNLAGSDSPRLLTLEMAIDWNGVSPEEKDSVLGRLVDFGKLRPQLRADIAETSRRLWDHSETHRVELTERGEGDQWKPIGFVALSDELHRVITERESGVSAISASRMIDPQSLTAALLADPTSFLPDSAPGSPGDLSSEASAKEEGRGHDPRPERSR
jgi:hypothetical protein